LEEKEIHLVKKVSKELGMTYKELGEEIGYSDSMLRQSVSKNKISSQLEKVLRVYLKMRRLEQKIKDDKKVKEMIKTFLN